eukprot:scaffold23526_cov51-Attheya_sp.AAC.2
MGTDSTTKEEERRLERRREKKERKTEKRKAAASGTTTTTTTTNPTVVETSLPSETKKEKKKKKDRKKEKRTRDHDDDDDDDDDDEQDKKKKKKRKRKEDAVDSDDEDSSVSSEKKNFVASSSSASPSKVPAKLKGEVTLLLFYTYVEPAWSQQKYQQIFEYCQSSTGVHGVTGRMRVATEGLNCTLTGTFDGVRAWCKALQEHDPDSFASTEFKLTDHLPAHQRFPNVKVFKVDELVNYGLGVQPPPLRQGGTHLEPKEYHKKINESNTVIIDVRNHYEAQIGRFQPPSEGAQWVDPEMRKSTEFPIWLEKPETKAALAGKQVLMYCTGGIRCERASALLQQKIETQPEMKALNISGIYQLQGGIDKYFKEFPDGGWWKGKNFTFDKRFAHAPPQVEAQELTEKLSHIHGESPTKEESGQEKNNVLGICEACTKPWDVLRGKRRCPTCGVPSLICRDCAEADRTGKRKLSRDVRCDLCVKEGIQSKTEIKEKEQRDLLAYQSKHANVNAGTTDVRMDGSAHERQPDRPVVAVKNPEGITRLFIKNLHSDTDEARLVELLDRKVTHIQWLTDRQTGQFYGTAFCEMASKDDAALAVANLHKQTVNGRTIIVKLQKANSKDIWPTKTSAISLDDYDTSYNES